MLAGQKAVVTGASKGIGSAIAEALAAEGAHVCLVARTEEALQETASRYRQSGAGGASIHPCDLADGPAADRLAEDLLAQHGCIDVLVNASGAYPDSGKIDPLEGDPDAWETAFSLNVLAPMRLTRSLAPAMADKGRGLVCFIGSVAGIKAAADEVAYAASKWRVGCQPHPCCLQSLRSHGIKVCLVEPAHVATDMALHQEGSRYEKVMPKLMIQLGDLVEAALLPLRMSPQATPAEIILNRQRTPYEA
ncbi:hypothetical protein ABPG77_003230 [Micractinium sp. CCAP 211/92]